jgi:SSS family transporter
MLLLFFFVLTEPTLGAEVRTQTPGFVQSQTVGFGVLNLIVLCLYPLVMLLIGWWCARKVTNDDDFFRAGQQIPWWAAGLSIYATMLSSITFMAIPAKAYATDWWFTLNTASIVILAPVVVYVFLPFFRQLNLTCAYEYLELRFNLSMRLFGSASFIIFQIARTGIVLYLPALAMSTVSNLDISVCIICMGLLTIAITFLGGMEAVIWTDVAQTIILLTAALLSLIVILCRLDGSLLHNLEIAAEAGKFYPPISFAWDWSQETFWVILIGNCFTTLSSYTSNQEVIQRFMTTSSEREAARAIWTNAILSIPSALSFFAVGTALFLFYHQFPGRLSSLPRTDAIFPYFMVHELPSGLAGFVVAGIFAAAQPTSSLNSVATAVVTDFFQRANPAMGAIERVKLGRIATVITGILGMSVALIMNRYPIESLWMLWLNTIGLTTGIVAGLFSLGILTQRATGFGAVCGVITSILVMTYAAMFSELHALMYGCLAVISTFVGGYAFSLLSSQPSKSLQGLTIYTLKSAARPAETAN